MLVQTKDKLKVKLPQYNGKIIRDKVGYQTLNDVIEEKSRIYQSDAKPVVPPSEEAIRQQRNMLQ